MNVYLKKKKIKNSVSYLNFYTLWKSNTDS